MPEESLLQEGHVFGEFTVYEFRIGSPDIEAIEAFGIILRKLSDKAEKKKDYATVFSNVADVLKHPEIWVIISAGLRKPVEECKKIPRKKLLEIYPKILEVNDYFFAETPEMIGRMYAVLIPKIPQKTTGSISSPVKESNSIKTT